MRTTALLTTSLGHYPRRSGKVRDIYELPDRLLLVATDRISAFDVVMPNGIPDKGRVLTQLSAFWFSRLAPLAPHHLISTHLSDLPEELRQEELDGRMMLCRKARVVPVECVVRGYITGSGWNEYKKTGKVCGIELPKGLKQCQKLAEPIFTPATKAEEGHDENISFQQACEIAGEEMMADIRRRSIELYVHAAGYAARRGIIVADTKFEWGIDADGQLMLVDEALTPDSSRFWPADGYKTGRAQPSFDKQFVRDYLTKIKFNGEPPAPPLPVEIVQKTRDKYIEAYTRLTGKDFPWQ